MRQIPAGWLTSDMEWRAPLPGGEGYAEPEATLHVRLELARPRSVREWSQGDAVSGTVFVDAVNSEGDVPPRDSLVSVDGGPEMVVREVRPYYVRGELHHTELAVA